MGNTRQQRPLPFPSSRPTQVLSRPLFLTSWRSQFSVDIQGKSPVLFQTVPDDVFPLFRLDYGQRKVEPRLTPSKCLRLYDPSR
jgi:hypothetical protein